MKTKIACIVLGSALLLAGVFRGSYVAHFYLNEWFGLPCFLTSIWAMFGGAVLFSDGLFSEARK